MTRVPASSWRAADPLRLVRTALGLPPARERPVGRSSLASLIGCVGASSLRRQTLAAAAQAAERLRIAVEGLALHYPAPTGARVLTISAGVAVLGRG